MTNGAVIFVDDDQALRQAAAQGLELAGFAVSTFASATAALGAISPDFSGVVVSDIRMPGLDGLAFFRRVQAIDADIPVLLVTGHGDIAMAVEALKDGVYDFVSKPFPMDRLVAALNRALEKRGLVLDNRRLQAAAAAPLSGAELLGRTSVMTRLRETIALVAQAEVDVLLQGETGVGKALVARLLHRAGRRRDRPMVTINCAALPQALAETELFGAVATSASGGRPLTGRIERADQGVLLLDEIDGLSPPLQARLLRLIEDREIWPVGAVEPRYVDLRIIAASKVDLAQAVRDGAFRADLYYRLNVVSLSVPPLRERREDIPLLFGHFLGEAAVRFGRPAPMLTQTVRHHLLHHSWPGNARELAHYAERIALGLADASPQAPDAEPLDLAQQVARYEAALMREVLAACSGDARAAMSTLGTPRKTFYDKLKRHQIDIADYRPARPA